MLTKKIACLVVDDDNIDILTTLSFINDYPFLEVIGSFNSPLQALSFAEKQAPDALFLDIDMDEMTGLELRKKLIDIPACIFITAYPDYAVEGFEMAALDFLVKPFSPERFSKAMERLKNYFSIREKADLLSHNLGADTIFIKDGYDQVKLQLHEIIYLEALKDYTGIVTAHRKYSVLSPLGSLIKEKAFSSFIRIHRSYAVQKNYIQKIASGELVVKDITLPVGRRFKEALKGL
ncbi:MAG: LytR/AlgR family response regulator transcription factor [Chitinophagaceae bacterium]